MQVLAALPPNVALKYTHPAPTLAAPAVSEYCNANVWLSPEPELGVAESAVTATAVLSTVQVPRVCQPLFTPPVSPAHRYTLFDPAKAELNARGRFQVSELPFSAIAMLATFSVHLLVCKVVWEPTAAPVQELASSFSKYTVLPGRL